MASTKDRLDSLEKKFQINRSSMTKQAKKAAKLEKKLKLLTGGYRSHAAALSKQINDTHEQCEQSFVEMNTFKRLQELEGQAIPRRLEVSMNLLTCLIYVGLFLEFEGRSSLSNRKGKYLTDGLFKSNDD